MDLSQGWIKYVPSKPKIAIVSNFVVYRDGDPNADEICIAQYFQGM